MKKQEKNTLLFLKNNYKYKYDNFNLMFDDNNIKNLIRNIDYENYITFYQFLKINNTENLSEIFNYKI